ncbi:MAG: HD domain-containing protein [Candidatus Goldbacteria bacterium]|nr:HD domain-containing protein [Candidatus Goldiibacteriota bacterium]
MKQNIILDKNSIENLLSISESIHNISDIDILLDKILFELRKFTNAEGGTIFLFDDGVLKIRYIQNEILFKNNPAAKYKYLDKTIPINKESIAGSCALNSKIIMVKDVYNIKEDCNCGFNKSFDEMTGYRTKSVIAVPLKTTGNKLIGVIQLINARNKDGKIIPFTEKDKLYITYFANDAAIAIEKAQNTRSMILKMLKMVEYRDPKETGGHVNRMGTYAIEIYHEWAKQRGFPEELIRRFNDKLKIAAMLHDTGKIAISDEILKKPDKLTDDELKIMKMHTVYGYRLFKDADSEIENMAADIALNHHEKWDGSGYPGIIEDIEKISFIENKQGKKGTEIPLTARIVALADVYDALSSKRIYKEPWSEDKVLDYIKQNSGKHFDPEIVDCFFSIYDTIKEIKTKISE